MDRVELSIDGTRYLSSLPFFLLPHLPPLLSHPNFCHCIFFFLTSLHIPLSNSRRTRRRVNFYPSYKYFETKINKKRKEKKVEENRGGEISFSCGLNTFYKSFWCQLFRSTQTKNSTQRYGEFIVPFVGNAFVKKTFNFRNFSTRFLYAFHIVLLS